MDSGRFPKEVPNIGQREGNVLEDLPNKYAYNYCFYTGADLAI